MPGGPSCGQGLNRSRGRSLRSQPQHSLHPACPQTAIEGPLSGRSGSAWTQGIGRLGRKWTRSGRQSSRNTAVQHLLPSTGHWVVKTARVHRGARPSGGGMAARQQTTSQKDCRVCELRSRWPKNAPNAVLPRSRLQTWSAVLRPGQDGASNSVATGARGNTAFSAFQCRFILVVGNPWVDHYQPDGDPIDSPRVRPRVSCRDLTET
jgi:hypothetical protein